MHPNPRFAWMDEAAMRTFVARRGFAHICIDGPMVAHAPLTVTERGTIHFHLARSNRVADRLEGMRAILSVSDIDGYISPDWYRSPDQVPTWNYVAVEIEGAVRALDEAALVEQLDALSATFEAALPPKPAWRRDKMTPGRFAAMLKAIRCFELIPDAWRGTLKLGQNKSDADRDALAEALATQGRTREADAVRGGTIDGVLR
ncbi:MAG: FMN-binding negative transcriptional regulator [Sphingomonadaceae bacterium]|nr:FMN-binding negative transcriptional regulator [Sphingomonadaceae bacterium]